MLICFCLCFHGCWFLYLCMCFYRCLFVLVCAFVDADFFLVCVYAYMLSWFWVFYPFVPCFGLFCIQELLLSWRVSFLPLSSGTTAENIMSLWYSILEKQYATSAIHQRYFNILRSQTATLTLLLCLSSTVLDYPSFGWDVKPRSWLSVVIKNPMALLVKSRGVTPVSWPNSHHWPLSIMAS